MKQGTQRPDDFALRRAHLEKLTDSELHRYFWSLADKAVAPLLALAKSHTSPAIERSVLLRMGFSSLEAKALVEKTIHHRLIGKGAGHVVFRYANLTKSELRTAGLELLEDIGWEKVAASFGVQI